ncbi:hypothetical protein V8C44DRAFT_353593 [Trichoderma aethiopicum]
MRRSFVLFRLHFAFSLLLASVPSPFRLISHPPQYSSAADPHLLDRQPGEQTFNLSTSHDPSNFAATATNYDIAVLLDKSDPRPELLPTFDNHLLPRICHQIQSALKPQSPPPKAFAPVEP